MSKQNTPASGAGGGKKRKWTEADNKTLLAHQAREQAAGNEHPWKGQAGPKGILPHLADLVGADLYRQAKGHDAAPRPPPLGPLARLLCASRKA
mmetsp:Transcript_14154/g.42185  ORF Transcript_14154/g.42185 Transcript_14154/m.42185 type:complete len:94 (-) Transcript_14154:490-771(-)